MSIIKTFKLYILKVFDLNEEELNKTLLLQLNIFIMSTYSVSVNVKNAGCFGEHGCDT